MYIYSDSTNLIDGYTMTQMIWYVIFTEIMWFGNSNQTLTSQMSQDIKSGSIAYGMNKPYNYLYFMISKHFGEMTIKLLLYLGLGIMLGYLFVGGISGFSIFYLPFIALVFLLGMLINSVLRMVISLISFWIEDATPFHWLYDKLILVIGTLFPVEVFPALLRPVIKLSPIFVITYGPAKLIIDFSTEMFYQVILAQLIYLVISVLILSMLYQKGVKKINVNGG
jgi:ABC-2 type transport system permease protein